MPGDFTACGERICSIKTRNPNPLPTGFQFGFLLYGRVEQKRYRLSALPLSYITHVMGTVSPRGEDRITHEPGSISPGGEDSIPCLACSRQFAERILKCRTARQGNGQ